MNPNQEKNEFRQAISGQDILYELSSKPIYGMSFYLFIRFQVFSSIIIEGLSSWCNGESDGLQNRSKRVRIPVALLRSLSGKYPWERYEPPYSPSYWLNCTTTVLLGKWLWH